MNQIEIKLLSQPKYQQLLGREQAIKLLTLFSEIENGKYDKTEIHQLQLTGLKHPIYLRAIRADMQSFVNTFIDVYLEKKAYMADAQFVIDAGANIGFTAVLFANWWPNCSIVSLEPDTENYELSVKNASAYKNVKVIHAGLWHKSAQLKIEAGQEDGFVVRELSEEDKNVDAQNLSYGISIDQLMRDAKVEEIDFLKMNIEGSEKEVFSENYQNWLPKTKSMLIELHDGKNAGCSTTVFKAIAEYPFAVAETAPYGVLFAKESIYRAWYAKWYKEEIYNPNINKNRFPQFYLDKEQG